MARYGARVMLPIHMSASQIPMLMREDGRVIYTVASVVDDNDHGMPHPSWGRSCDQFSRANQLFEALEAEPRQP